MTRENSIAYRAIFSMSNSEGYRAIRLLKEIYERIPSTNLHESQRFNPILSLLEDKSKYSVGLDCTLMTDAHELDVFNRKESYKGDLPCYIFRFFLIDSKISAEDLIIIMGRTSLESFKYFVDTQVFKINNYLGAKYTPKNDESVWHVIFIDLIKDYKLSNDGLRLYILNNEFFTKNTIIKFCLYDSNKK